MTEVDNNAKILKCGCSLTTTALDGYEQVFANRPEKGESGFRRCKEAMYAVIETGGKQYKVQEGDVIRVEKLTADEGQTLDIDKVLLVEKDGNVTVGTPVVSGACVTVKIMGHGKADKVIAFRYKPKKNVRIKKGHRQPYTQLSVETIKA